MRTFFRILIIVIGFTTALGYFSSAEAQSYVAKVADRPISENLFRMRYAYYLLRTGLPDNSGLRQSMLETLVTSELIVKQAEVNGIKQTPEYQAQVREAHRKMSIEAYTNRVLNPQIQVSEAELTDMFVRMNTTLRARHLYALTLQKANALATRLKAGETFEQLAKEVFADSALANNGGDLGTFTFDEMDPNFEDAAYKLKVGEVSKPVRTSNGFSIIQVTDRFTKPLMTETEFANKKDQITTFVKLRKQRQLKIDHVEQLAQELNLVFNANGVSRLMENLQGKIPIRQGEKPDDWLKTPLVTFGIRPNGTNAQVGVNANRKTWTIQDFRQNALQNTSPRQLAEVKESLALKELIKGLLVQEEMVQRANRLNLTKLPEFTDAVQLNISDWVIAKEMSRLNQKVEVPEDTVKAFFERDKAQLKSEAQVFVTEILVDDLQRAQALKAQATVQNFESLAARFSQRPRANEVGGKLGFVNRQELGVLADRVFAAKKDDILGPIEVKGKYILLRIGDALPSLPLTYEQAKPVIEQQLWSAFADRYMRQYRAELQQRYGNQIQTNMDLVTKMKLVN